MKLFGKWILLAAFALSINAQAAVQTYECKFTKRLDETSTMWSDELEKDVSISSYEDVSDFTFEDYEWLTIESVTDGWEVSVGAMSYGDGQFSSEPSTITKSLDANIAVFSYNNPEGDNKWQVRLNPQTHIAKFIAEDDDGKFIETAEFTCE